MENPPFEDVFPIQDGDFPLLCFVYRRVNAIDGTGWLKLFVFFSAALRPCRVEKKGTRHDLHQRYLESRWSFQTNFMFKPDLGNDLI